MEITGTEGTVILEQDRILAANLRHPQVITGAVAPDENPERVFSIGQRRCLRIFFKRSSETPTPVCDGREGRRSIALVEAIYRAAQNGGAEPVLLDKH